MAAKMLGYTLTDKIENRKADMSYTGLGLKYSDFHARICSWKLE